MFPEGPPHMRGADRNVNINSDVCKYENHSRSVPEISNRFCSVLIRAL